MVCGKESKPKENKAFRGSLGDRTKLIDMRTLTEL